MTDKVHAHGALAGVELWYSGYTAQIAGRREIPIAPAGMPTCQFPSPFQARAMDKEDIRNLRRWHRNAALRARAAGFDIVYVYAGHGLGIFQHFLVPRDQHAHRRIRRHRWKTAPACCAS